MGRIEMDVHLPEDFPEQYRDAVIRAVDLCAVKKHMDRPPVFDVRTVVAESQT